jgi:hypothetical protein
MEKSRLIPRLGAEVIFLKPLNQFFICKNAKLLLFSEIVGKSVRCVKELRLRPRGPGSLLGLLSAFRNPQNPHPAANLALA